VVRLLSRDVERRSMGEAAHAVMERERGAVERTMAIVEKMVGEAKIAKREPAIADR
jgi:3-deoxy-D-manno-octulosonic-acid transferase